MADPRIARIAATLNAAAAAASITIKAQLDTIGDAAVAEVAALFPGEVSDSDAARLAAAT